MEQEKDDSLEYFLKWAAELGISDSTNTLQYENPHSCLGHSLSVSYFPDAGGRGLAAVRDVWKGELILRVPKSALMTRESLLKDLKLKVAAKSHPSLSSTQTLIVFLLAEMGKGKSSWWHPYLMQLPHSYDILATFSQVEVPALQVDEAIWASEKAISKAKSEWKEAIALMNELNLKSKFLAFRAWLWASATISSRTLHIPWDDAGCLCPVGDFFNYAPPGEELLDLDDLRSCEPASSLQASSLWNGDIKELYSEQSDAHSQRLTDGGYEEDIAMYCFYARKDYKAGDQVLLSYGTYTNLELLEHYGFLLNENPNDKVFIPLETNIYSSSSWPRDSFYIHHNGKPSFALLSALRLWATPPNQRRSVGHLAYSGSQLSVLNELLVMKWVMKKCNLILKNLPTTIEQDRLLLLDIDKMDDDDVECPMKLLLSNREVHSLLESNGLQNEGCGRELVLSWKMKRSLNRWKLAVQWRVGYKKILVDCISYCTEIIDSLSSENVSNKV